MGHGVERRVVARRVGLAQARLRGQAEGRGALLADPQPEGARARIDGDEAMLVDQRHRPDRIGLVIGSRRGRSRGGGAVSGPSDRRRRLGAPACGGRAAAMNKRLRRGPQRFFGSEGRRRARQRRRDEGFQAENTGRCTPIQIIERPRAGHASADRAGVVARRGMSALAGAAREHRRQRDVQRRLQHRPAALQQPQGERIGAGGLERDPQRCRAGGCDGRRPEKEGRPLMGLRGELQPPQRLAAQAGRRPRHDGAHLTASQRLSSGQGQSGPSITTQRRRSKPSCASASALGWAAVRSSSRPRPAAFTRVNAGARSRSSPSPGRTAAAR